MPHSDTTAPVYLDHCATTPVDPRVLEKMLPFFTSVFGNASSTAHAFGRLASDAVESARVEVASLAECEPEDVIWTSGATESNNLLLTSFAARTSSHGIGPTRILTQPTEHKAVLDPIHRLRQHGSEVRLLPVNVWGQICNAQLTVELERYRPNLVTIMAANNETGVLFPIERVAQQCQDNGTLFHTDASQSFGKVAITLKNADFISVSSHKLYGPKGVGALVCRGSKRRKYIEPLFLGGGQEKSLRSGTLNVAGIVGFGEACRIARSEMASNAARIGRLRDDFERRLAARIADVEFNSAGADRLPGVSSVALLGVDAESVMLGLHRIAVSSGSACTTESIEPSHVLREMGLSESAMLGTIRVSFGRSNTSDDVETAVDEIASVVGALRGLQADF